MLAFFIMIFDSLRQGRPAIRNSLGVSRFNTRLNFYLYEIARIRFVQQKGLAIARTNSVNPLVLNALNFTNNELLEVTLYSYTFVDERIEWENPNYEYNNSVVNNDRDETLNDRSNLMVDPEHDE